MRRPFTRSTASPQCIASTQSGLDDVPREPRRPSAGFIGPEHLLTLRAACNLASALEKYAAGDDPAHVAEALALLQRMRDGYKRVLGPDHPETYWADEHIGFGLAQGKFAEAHAVLAPLRERCLKTLGPSHLETAAFAETLALAEEGPGPPRHPPPPS